ncbi:Acetyl-CoA C-acetyltransferase [mine drainage metagenome]|uniref:Acetyl-CoA C-acetyltransferase n=2 Tax=mine drainage metagenome TaxID=410659 RepID=T1CGR3_9ZZZZ
MTDASDIVIVDARRSPIGSFQGSLAPLAAPEILAPVIRALLAARPSLIDAIDETLIGCVLPAGVGQAPARQATRLAGLPDSTGATTINKVCGSGMKTVLLADALLRSGQSRMIIAGGMESMSQAPYLLPRARAGYRMGHERVLDHMLYDGLENASDHRTMGEFAELCAERYAFDRASQDAYAIRSAERARAAQTEGAFHTEITPISVTYRGRTTEVSLDEGPGRIDFDKIKTLKPAFRKDGTVTAASSSSISDGAAALLLTTRAEAERLKLPPLARLAGVASHAQAPEWFTTAPIGAIRNLSRKVGWEIGQVDLFEINEAFAVVTLAAIRDLGLDPERVNVHGGACALGHPIGASGARLIVTLVHALARRGLQRGIASLCIGGGEATAVAIERSGT